MLILSKFLLLQLLVMIISEICKGIVGGCSLAALNHSYINKSLYLAQKYVQILNICAYFCGQILSAYTICSKMQTVSFKEQIMSKDKYMSIFSHKIEAIVFIILQIFCNTHLKIFTNSSLFASWDVFSLLL